MGAPGARHRPCAQVALAAVHGVSALAGPRGMDGTPFSQILEETLDVLWRGMGGS